MSNSIPLRYLLLASMVWLPACGGDTSDEGHDLSTQAVLDMSTGAAHDLTTDTANDDGLTLAAQIAAATATAKNNAACTLISPFWWEVGDANGMLGGASVGVDSSGDPILGTTLFEIASASKWLYGIYVVQTRGAADSLTAKDVDFLHFTSGYTWMGSDTKSATCTDPPDGGVDSIDYCLTLPSAVTGAPAGTLMSTQDPATVGAFHYDSGHEENHAGQLQPELNGLPVAQLGSQMLSVLGLGSAIKASDFTYRQPLLAGGTITNSASYATILRAVLSGKLAMLGALGTNPVCAWKDATGKTCGTNVYSPIVSEKWHYSVAHWVEDDPTSSDGAFSSPGAFGFYPWIDAAKQHYGVISRYAATGTTGANGQEIQNGVASAQCGYLLRRAWATGVEQ